MRGIIKSVEKGRKTRHRKQRGHRLEMSSKRITLHHSACQLRIRGIARSLTRDARE